MSAAAGDECAMGGDGEAAEVAFSLSVIIPTKDRPRFLRQTVESLLAQSHLPQQLVIVDQSPNPTSRAAVTASAACRGVELLYLHAPEICGAAEARNRAMSLAQGAIWLFLDDDVVLEPGFMAGLLAAYRLQPRAAGISGIITNYVAPRRAVRLWQGAFFRGPFADDRQPVYWRAGQLGTEAPLIPVSRLGAGLMSFWASMIGESRFDTRLAGDSMGEDVDFCFRLPQRGQFFIAPGARLSHLRASQQEHHQYPLEEAALSAWYLHLEHPQRHRHQTWLFAWLNFGLLLAAAVASVRRVSVEPFQRLGSGAAGAIAIHRESEASAMRH